MADLFTYRASTILTPGVVEVPHQMENRWVHLYCWPCRTVHEFTLKDVEKIVYALGPVGDDQYSSGFDDGSTPGMAPVRESGDPQPCWREVLRWADDSEMYAEHVEQGIECRERSDG